MAIGGSPGRRFTHAAAVSHRRCARGIGAGDTVAAMLPNIPAMYEAHFGVAMAGAVLNHAQYAARCQIDSVHARPRRGESPATDREFSDTIEKALRSSRTSLW
jgi:fatty-acyl-CoA synthase